MKKVIVTGVSRGLGEAIAFQLLKSRENYEVIGIARTESDSVRHLRHEFPQRFQFVPFDLAESEAIEGLYLNSLKALGPIYGLVNNAAHAYDDLLTNASPEKLQTMLDVNIRSPILLTKYCVRDMLLNGTQGSIVFISSITSATGFKGLSMYGATKAALEAFMRGAAREWGSKGIRFNVVAPGFMETEMSATLSAEQREKIYRRTALKKATDKVAVAKSVEFVLDPTLDSMTGEVIRVDCGAT